MVKREESISKASAGYIKGYYNASKTLPYGTEGFGSLPAFDREKALETIRKDSTVVSAITTLVDKSMENGFKIGGKDNKSNISEFEQVLDRVRFKKYLREAFFNAYTYQNVFTEIVKDGNGKTKELHILETTMTEPVVDEHGTVKYYQQIVAGSEPEDYPKWTPDEVTHIVLSKYTTAAWGEIDIQSVYTSVLIKQYIYNHLGWFFGTNQLRNFFNIKNASDVQVKDFINYLKNAEKDLGKPLIAEGEITNEMLNSFRDGSEILAVVQKCDENILSMLQTPPISTGNPSDSNRSNSDAQDGYLNTRVKAIQDVFEEAFEYDTFPKMGYPKGEISFNPLSKPNTSKILEIAERMSVMNFKQEAIEDYLELEGFPIKGELFMTPEEIAKKNELTNPIKKSEDLYEGRKRKESDEGNKRIGTGEAGTTREEQVAKGKSKFNNYPYVYDIR